MRDSLVVLVAAVALNGCSPSSSSDAPSGGTGGTGGAGGSASGGAGGAGGNECPATTGKGTEHSGATTLTASETWAAADGPHIVTGDIQVGMGGTLTIEPCVEVRMRGPRQIVVDEGGKLLAEGTSTRGIRVVPEDAATPWNALQIFGPGSARLAYATLEGGGAASSSWYGAIEVRGDQLAPAQELLFVDHVTVKGSSSYGVSLRAGATFTKDSHDLVITGSATAPVRVLPRLVTNLPKGTYTGNKVDAVQVETEAYGDVTLEDVTFHDLGVPYLIGGGITVGELKVGGGAGLVTLTIDPGVTMKFAKNDAAGLTIDTGSTDDAATGALVAIGTEAKPIVFTSASSFPVQGDWRGLTFGKRPDIKDRIDFAHIEYTGAPTQANGFHCNKNGMLSENEDAAISLYGQPTFAFVTNTTFLAGNGLGVNLAYKGMTFDFLTSNTFTTIVGCKQSTPRNADGTCPTMVSCP
jgi:hypothetical protein